MWLLMALTDGKSEYNSLKPVDSIKLSLFKGNVQLELSIFLQGGGFSG